MRWTGDRLYDDLPAIRDAVAAQMAALSVSLASPADGATVSGTVSVAADARAGDRRHLLRR